jgi:protein-S-isoprenylcysteine O-methyltransferase Ste14
VVQTNRLDDNRPRAVHEQPTPKGPSFADALVSVVASVPLYFYAGFVLSKFWGWFVTAEIAQPTLTQFAAAWMTIKWATSRSHGRDDTAEEKRLKWPVGQTIVVSIMITSVMLLIGYLIHLVDVLYVR